MRSNPVPLAIVLLLALAVIDLTVIKRFSKCEVISIHVGQASLHVEVARSESQRELGLMDRSVLPESNGMLFVLAKPQQATFWMKDTRIPLSIAFIDHSGTILEIYDMRPDDLSITASKSSTICYALETNLHWFSLSGVHLGDRIDCSPSLDHFLPQ